MLKLLLSSIALFGIAVAASGPAGAAGKVCKAETSVRVDPEAISAGRKAFIGCASCHDLARGKTLKIGPALGSMFDGKPLAAINYNYSPAFRAAAPDWRNTNKLDSFLAKPSSVVPGTKMTFAGIAKEGHRKNLIAYLKSAIGRPGCK